MLSVKYKDLSELAAQARNPRTHSKRQIKQIAASIKEFGFVNSVLIDERGNIIAGHGRVAAAKQLDLKSIPTVCIEGLTPAQIQALVVADNKIAENAGWDRRLLALDLQEIELNFNVTITGFEVAEADIIIGELADNTPDGADDVSAIDLTTPAVSQLGDLWRIGNHRLLCADALQGASFEKLLVDQRAEMCFLDPPYNVPIARHVSGLGKKTHREFAMGSGEMDDAAYIIFLGKLFANLVAFSNDGSIHFLCMDWRHMRHLQDAADGRYAELKNLCVWSKRNAGMGSLYRSQHELIFVYKNGTKSHINNVELGRFGRSRTNVWNYAGVNSFGKNRDAELAIHPTVKPLALVADAILDCSNRGGIILDCCAGSGTTLLAAHKADRLGFGIELDPHYVDATIDRMATLYGLKAIHAETGLGFDAMRQQRLKERC